MEWTILHNPRCSKSRAGLEHLQKNVSEFEVFDYMKTGISVDQLRQVCAKLNKKPTDMIRTHEDLYKENFKGKKFTDDEWLVILSENPKLLQRPIVIRNNKAVLVNPIENFNELL